MSDNIKIADKLFSDGLFPAAEKVYLNLLQSNSNNTTILEKLGTLALYKNEVLQAEKYYKKALAKKSWLSQNWPLGAQLKYRLATTYFRDDRFKQAAKWFHHAAGPFGFRFVKELSIKGSQIDLFEKVTPYLIEGEDETCIEFVILDPLPVVKVAVNHSKPVNFFIDTGAEEIIVDKQFAKETQTTIIGEILQEYAGAEKGLTGYGKINALSIGGMLVKNILIHSIDLQAISLSVFNGMEIKGAIGTRFLMHFLSTIDYKNKQLILRKKTKDSHIKFQRQYNLLKYKEIPFSLVENHLIFSRGSFNHQQSELFFIDTGLADAGFLTSKARLKKAGVVMDWRKAELGVGGGGTAKALNITIDKVSLGSDDNAIVEQNIKGVVFENELSIFKDQLGFIVGGLVSHQVFREYALTLDFNKMKLYLHT